MKIMKNMFKLFIFIVLVCLFTAACASENGSPDKFSGRQSNEYAAKQPEVREDSSGQKDKPDDVQDNGDNNKSKDTPLTDNKKDKDGSLENEPKERKIPKNIKARAVYLTGVSAGSKKVLDRIIELSKTTELNAVVIDVKDDYGKVNYQTDFPEARQIGAFHRLYDVDGVVKTLHDNGIYVIGRIVTFKDPLLGEKRADLAVKRPNGSIYREGTAAWVNPYNQDVWKYNIEIAKEAVNKGFDEIQFDYVRFPAARKSDVSFGENLPPKTDAIGGFLKTAYKELHEGMGVIVSADVFGIICESPGDMENIGQDIEKVGMDIDYICPMVYPSHYANASRGVMGNGMGQSINGVVFTAPDLKPYEVVYNTLLRCKDRISKVQGYKAKVRPYLQAFTASYIKDKSYYQRYGPEQIRQQVKAVYDAGYDEWILWDPANAYPEGAFEKKGNDAAGTNFP